MATSTQPLAGARTPSLDRAPRYYEADGALRAYANRSIVFAVLAGVVAVGAVAGMIFVRVQPPTVIRVLPSGEATVVSPGGTFENTVKPTALHNVIASESPTDFEKEAYVRTFLTKYLNYDSHTIATNWSDALNMMTGNLRNSALAALQKDDTVGKYEDENVRSLFTLVKITISPTDPLRYTAYGTREVHRMAGGQTENVETLVESYDVSLAETERSALNPTGLLVGNVLVSQLHSETKVSSVPNPGMEMK